MVSNDKPVIHPVQGSNINGCVIGCNSYVGQGAYLEDSLIMGNDNYTNDKERLAARQRGESVLGIGEYGGPAASWPGSHTAAWRALGTDECTAFSALAKSLTGLPLLQYQ